jgi:hypothetical protein
MVEPIKSVRRANLFANNQLRFALADKFPKDWEEVAVILKLLSFSGDGERLAWKR